MGEKEKHLEMIQGVINRMASNSFMLKGWSVVLVSALFVLAGKDAKVYFAILAIFPAAMFWILDGYFLRQERLFRELYDEVRKKDKNEGIDYSMDTRLFTEKVDSWPRTCKSTTLKIFHGTIMGTIILVIIIILLFPLLF
jgi:hypothetical protein